MTDTPTLWVLNGPNLNLLGQREPEIYGRETLADVERSCLEACRAAGYALEFRQSNHEGALITWIHEARGRAAGLIINAGGYTHTSIAIQDALRLFDPPVIEIHISNIYRRESFRHRSYISAAADAVLCGFGIGGYALAIQGLAARLAGAE